MQIQLLTIGILWIAQGLKICNIDSNLSPTLLDSDNCFKSCPLAHTSYAPYTHLQYGQPSLSPVACGWCIGPQICQNGLVVGCQNGAQLMLNEFCCLNNCSFCWLYGCLACVLPSKQYISDYGCVPCVTPQICQNSRLIACSNGFQLSGNVCLSIIEIASISGYYIQDGQQYICNTPLVCSQDQITGCLDQSNSYLSSNTCLPCPSNGYCGNSSLVGYPLNYNTFNSISSNCYSLHCIKCPNMFYCTTCQTGYWLYLNQFCCPQNCSQCSFNSCQRCISPSTQYINGFDCTNCLVSQICQNSKFIGCQCGYNLIASNQCQVSANTCSCTTTQYLINGVQAACPPNALCSQCQLIGCTSGIAYYLSNNQCLDCTLPLLCQSSIVVSCQGPYYLIGSRCFSCQSSLCATCVSQFQCSSCINDYWLYQREYCCGLNCAQCNLYTCLVCVAPNSQYISGFGCDLCSNTQICQNSSLVGCSAEYYFDSTINQCIACPPGCVTCISSSCLTVNCASPTLQYYSNGQCANCPTNAQCSQYQIIGCIPKALYYLSQYECISCTYPLLCSQSAIVSCSDQFYLTGNSCRPCLPLNCATCVSQLQCSSCITGYWLYDSQYCCGQNCAQCDLSGCLGCVSPNSQYLIGFGCQDCGTTQNCQNSRDVFNSIIPSCQPNTQFYLDQNQCVPCTTQMRCQGSQIVGCNGPYYLSGVSCLPCYQTSCATCLSQYVCSTCIGGYTLYQGQFCCAPNCTTCSYYQCYSCLDPINQFIQGVNCLSCPAPFQCQNSVIIGCIGPQYFTNPANCTPCGQNCANCDSASCFQCLSPDSQYISGSQCVQCLLPYICTNSRISSCSLSYYLGTNDQCLQCPTQCLSCDSTKCYSCIPPCQTCTFTTCLSCIGANWYISGITCTQCPTQCATCDQYVCTTCLYPNQYVSGYTCVTCPQWCASCNQTQCNTCMSPCKSCDLTQCLSCVEPNYYLQGTLCTECGTNCEQCTQAGCIKCSYQNSYITGMGCTLCPHHCPTCSANLCLSCQPPCQTCSQTECLTCQLQNQYISGVTCLTCPTQCLTCNKTTCLTCPLPCLICDFNGCLQCSSGYYLTMTNSLKQCQLNCSSLVLQPYEECNDGNKVSRDGCTNCLIDPGYICQNTEDQISICVKLPPGCLKALFQGNQIICTLCQSGYLLNNITCILSTMNIDESRTYQINYQNNSPILLQPNQTFCIQIDDQCDNYLSFNFENMYQNNDIYLKISKQLIFSNIQISNITITDYLNTEFTYNQTFNETLYLNFNFSKSINPQNLIQLQMIFSGNGNNQTQGIIMQPNPQQVLSAEQKQTQQNIQTSMQGISTTFFITLMLTPLLGGFSFIFQFMDIIAWLSTFYYINVTYPYNVNLFFQTISFNFIFFNLPQLSTPFNQATDPYYFVSPYKFMQNLVDPLFINNILQPLFIVISPILIYLVSIIWHKVFPLPEKFRENQVERTKMKQMIKSISEQALNYQRNIFSIILRQILLNMLDIFLASVLQILSNPPQDYLIIKVNSFIAIATMAAVGALLYQVFRQSQKHYSLVNTKQFRYTYEPIYSGLKVKNFEHRLYGCMLLYSKIAYTLSLVYFYDHPLLQTSFCTCPYFLIVTYIIYSNPYETTEALLTQGIPNMCVFGVLSVTVIIACNERIQILQNTEIFGWLILCFIWISMSIQLLFLLRLQVMSVIRWIKQLKEYICS